MDDMISRQEAIDALKAVRYGLWEIDIPSPTVPEYVEHHEQIKNMIEITDGWIKKLKELPPAHPETCEYWDDESDYCALYRPSAVLVRKKGRWINDNGLYRCSSCNQLWAEWWAASKPIERMKKEAPYCPMCGSYNGEGSEDE